MPEAFESQYPGRLILGAARFAAAIIRFLLPVNGRMRWREVQNKLCTLDLFLHASVAASFAADKSVWPPQSSKRVQRVQSYASIWTWEGLGYRYALEKATEPTGLLSSSSTEFVPDDTLIPLHSGMGMALARRLLTDYVCTPSAKRSAVLAEFYRLCNFHSREGYRGIAYESIGFAAQILYPELTDEIDRDLRATDPILPPYFWHGVGRAIYFAPHNLAPWRNSLRSLLEVMEHKVAFASARQNALAGFAFAVTLVNIRHPEVLEYLVRHHELRHEEEEVFAGGARAACVAWLDITGNDLCLSAFCRYRPRAGAAGIRECFVFRACRKAQEHHRELKSAGRLDEVFRCTRPSGG